MMRVCKTHLSLAYDAPGSGEGSELMSKSFLIPLIIRMWSTKGKYGVIGLPNKGIYGKVMSKYGQIKGR